MRLFEKYGVAFNILCVVTGKNARSIQRLYQFFKKQNFKWLQFIPCLEPMELERGTESYHLSVRSYGDFLIRIFDLWFQDLQKGEYISIRHLDNWISIMLGEPPESCDMNGHCSVQFVIEGDGGVYLCDFYALDQWRLGTVGEQGFAELAKSAVARHFIETSLPVPEKCQNCPAYPICRNGYRRNRLEENGVAGVNYYCHAYRRFFTERARELKSATRIILQMHGLNGYWS